MAVETAGPRPDDRSSEEGGPERDLHHITRIDISPSEAYPNRHPTHGWQVRARRDGERLSKFFADARHGGKEGACTAALAYRDQLLASMPDPDPTPRKAWSNTGVVGLSVREKSGGDKLYVHLNWMDREGKRRASSYSVEKWGLRRALWNACLKLYRERSDAGAPVEEPHVMFARAQEPFQDLILKELEAEKAAETEEAREAARQRRDERNREAFESPEAQLAREEQKLRDLESALFG